MLNETVKDTINKVEKISKKTKASVLSEEVGQVIEIVGNIVTCSGLSSVQMDEMVSIQESKGIVINLDEDKVGIILLDNPKNIKSGDKVKRLGHIANVPVGPELLGRVIDPIGNPLDNGPKIITKEKYNIEREAHPIMERQAVSTPLQTGIKAIDAIIPIGRGQRELILGDRQTGKTAIAIDAIISQKDTGVICIYCAIGQRSDSVAKVIDVLKQKDCMKNTIVMVASGESSPGLLYIAPYAATSMAEYFMEREGKDVLIIYDNLSTHAQAYRQLSLFLRRPPGREAFPGDIFYIHSRLLERSTHLRKEYGGGSITALPICETLAENVSAYIPTNLISITDGQIFLTNTLFQKGIIPAINIGISVSRVGSKAQLPAYKAVAGDMKISYSQFEELEAFSKFGTQLDEATQKTLARGERIRETLKQSQYKPLKASEQIVVIYATNIGVFDDVPLNNVHKLQDELVKQANVSLKHILDEIDNGAKLNEKFKEEIAKFANDIVKTFNSGI
ncbi:MAG: F0F1 ATP synthase subunit alpha [Alphaproteobacteria bacterium]|nr:F0F1 ATP synthase subunit alpha [Alphaproteobacteria bacterium]